MQRIMVMGPPGSGKSSLARHLGEHLGLPVFHLDQAFHQPGWIPVAEPVFQAEVERIAALPAWVIDGNYAATIECRLRAADTLIYLDLPRWLTMLRILDRIIVHHGRTRADSAEGCPERLSLAFLHFAWTWNRNRRQRNMDIIARFDGRKIILGSRSEQRQFYRQMATETASVA